MPAGLRGARRRRAADVQQALRAACTNLLARSSSRPTCKFIIEMSSAIARVGTVVIRDCARVLGEVCKAAGTVEKRLSAHLQDPALWRMINVVMLDQASPAIQVYTPIAIDLTDSQRRHAFATPGVEGNYDGSAGVPGRGYTHLCAAAIHLADNGRQRQLVPLLQDTLSETRGGPIGMDDKIEVETMRACTYAAAQNLFARAWLWTVAPIACLLH